MARQGFQSVGSAVIGVTQRLAAWTGADPSQRALIEDVRRWGLVWQYAVMQVGCLGVGGRRRRPPRLLHPPGKGGLTRRSAPVHSDSAVTTCDSLAPASS